MYHAGFGIVVNKKDNTWDVLSDVICSNNPSNARDRMYHIELNSIKVLCLKYSPLQLVAFSKVTITFYSGRLIFRHCLSHLGHQFRTLS